MVILIIAHFVRNKINILHFLDNLYKNTNLEKDQADRKIAVLLDIIFKSK